MADYFPPISEAVKGLEKSTAETRRAIYDLARAAMVAQLRSMVPALSESDINRQQLALEEAIAKVEAESSGRSQTPSRLSVKKGAPAIRSVRSRTMWVGSAIIFICLLTMAATMLSRGSVSISSLLAMPNLDQTTGVAGSANSAAPLKSADRIDSFAIASARSKVNASDVQEAILYEEDKADPAGRRFGGTAAWRTETGSPRAGEPPTVALRADVTIPEEHLGMRWTLRNNDDAAMSASHTLEIMFSLPPEFSHGGISGIAGVLAKQAEASRGIPLAGLGVKVAANYFLFSLSSKEVDLQRNVQLLKEAAWLELPVIYNDGYRAIIVVEKRGFGDRAFYEAFAAWESAGMPAK
jgi:hypothetical protein